MSNGFKIFPRRDCSNRSCLFTVGCGEAALLTGFDLPKGAKVCINKVQQDCCKGEHLEKEHCEFGRQAGMTGENCSGVVNMPGTYVAVLCVDRCECDEPVVLPKKGWGVYVNVCEAHQNLQTMAQTAALGS